MFAKNNKIVFQTSNTHWANNLHCRHAHHGPIFWVNFGWISKLLSQCRPRSFRNGSTI